MARGGRVDLLPLLCDVGEALVSYLRRRPRSECRTVFLKVLAPAGSLSGEAIWGVVHDACARRDPSGRSPPAGTHRRDRDAQGGASLAEIGQVLRHRDEKTTAQYAKGRPRGAHSARAGCAGAGGMTPLQQALRDYLRIRRRLGFELKAAGRLLERFVEFLEQAGAARISIELALMWARLPVDAHPHWWRRRLGIVRGFARHLAMIDPASEIPSKDLLPAHRPRVVPYIYSQEQITALIAAARTLTPPLRAVTFTTLIGLLSVSGVRIGEALALAAAAAVCLSSSWPTLLRQWLTTKIVTISTDTHHTSQEFHNSVGAQADSGHPERRLMSTSTWAEPKSKPSPGSSRRSRRPQHQRPVCLWLRRAVRRGCFRARA